jgi:predicted esterase
MKKLIVAMITLFPLLSFAAARSLPANATPEQFAQWQQDTRAFLAEALLNGPPPEPVELSPVFGRKEAHAGYDLTEVSFTDRPGHATSAWLARPLAPKAARLPVIIALHGHGGDAHDAFNPDHLFFYGDLFARQGYLVLSVNIGHDYLDANQSLLGYGPLPKNVSFPAMGQRVWMVMRAIDFMSTQPDADLANLAVVGLSNGGLTTMFVAALDPRVKLAVASGSLIMHDRMWHRELLHCRCQYLDKLDGQLDYSDVFALVAPRYLVVQSGEKDPIFPIHSANKAFEFIKKAYTIAGVPDRVIHDVHPGPHAYSAAVPDQWVHKYLPLSP